MCVASMIYDHFRDKWDKYPRPQPYRQVPPVFPYVPYPPLPPQIMLDEIKEFKELLEKARKYDEENNQKDCELDEKKELLKKIAKELGVEIGNI